MKQAPSILSGVPSEKPTTYAESVEWNKGSTASLSR
jgi:hypothetical protein